MHEVLLNVYADLVVYGCQLWQESRLAKEFYKVASHLPFAILCFI